MKSKILLFALLISTQFNLLSIAQSIKPVKIEIDLSDIKIDKGCPFQPKRFIPLETHDSVLIGSIDEVVFCQNRFYILDARFSKTLYVFTPVLSGC